MKPYRVQIEMGGCLPPDGWGTIFAEDNEDAAVKYLRRMKPRAEAFPMTVHVADGKLKHLNGGPIMTHGFTFAITE